MAMAIRYSVDFERNVLHTVCAGAVRLDDVLVHLEELVKDRTLPDDLDLLLDLSTTTTAPSADQLRLVAERVTATREDITWGRCAIVVSRDVLFGLSRMFEVHTASVFEDSHVFRDRDEALEWLEAGPPDR